MSQTMSVQMSFHFFFSALKGDSDMAAKIAARVSELRPGDIFSFLMTLGSSIDGHSSQIEMEYPPYKEYRAFVCNKIKHGNLDDRFYFPVGDNRE